MTFDYWERIGGAFGSSVPGELQLSLCMIVLLSVISVPIVFRLISGRRVDPLSPTVMLSVFTALSYILPLSSFLVGEDVFSRRWPYFFTSVQRAAFLALALTISGVLGFQWGYVRGSRITFKPRAVPYFIWRVNYLRILCVVFVLAGIGLFCTGVVLVGGYTVYFGSLGDRLRLMSGLNYLFMAINLVPAVALIWWAYLISVRDFTDIRFYYTSCSR